VIFGTKNKELNARAGKINGVINNIRNFEGGGYLNCIVMDYDSL
jgi:hypothetical protein